MKKWIINIEGCDGIGKTTICNKLPEILSKEFDIPVTNIAYQHFPDYDTPTGKLIKHFLNGELLGDPTKADPFNVSMLYTIDRVYNYYNSNMDQYDIVIHDRSHISNIFYQGVKVLKTILNDPDYKEFRYDNLPLDEKDNFRRYINMQYYNEKGTYGDFNHMINLYLTYDNIENSFNQTSKRIDNDLQDTDHEYLKRVDYMHNLIEPGDYTFYNRKYILDDFCLMYPGYRIDTVICNYCDDPNKLDDTINTNINKIIEIVKWYICTYG